MIFQLPNRVAENIADFTGRRWLLPPLLEWFNQTNDRMFILQGEPGTGKSMIIAWLAGAGPEHVENEAKSQLQQIRSQVKAVHFCIEASGNIAPKAFAQNIGDQLTRNVEGFGEALAATLADQVTISGRVDTGIVETGGSTTGVYIERLDMGSLSDELSFDRVFREPLKRLYDGGYTEPMLLLVDGLDEAETYTGSPTIVRLLARLTDLPIQIRFLVTTRPDPRVLKHYRGVTLFHLINDSPADEDDVRPYVIGRLAELDDAQRNRLADRIGELSEGNFLYTHLVLNELLSRLSDIPQLDLDKLKLPKGLSGVYHEFLNRELGENEDRWYNDFKSVLGLIAVAQGEGLSWTQLARIIGKEVESSLRICKQYLDGDLPDGPFRLFHKSFTGFLLEDEVNIDYHIDAKSVHRQIADYYLSRFAGKWSECDEYGLSYLAMHLAEAGLVEELHELLSYFDWLEAAFDATNTHIVAGAYGLLPKDAPLRRVGDALRAAHHILTVNPTELPAQVYGRLISECAPEMRNFLAQMPQRCSRPWLRTLSSSLSPVRGRFVRVLPGRRLCVLMPDGSRVVTVDEKNAILVVDLTTGRILREWPSQAAQSTWKTHSAILITPDGLLAVSARGNVVDVWDLETGENISTFGRHADEINAITLMSNGHTVVSASGTELLVWELKTGKIMQTLSGHKGKVSAVAALPEDRCISAGDDQTLKVWDIGTGQTLRTLGRVAISNDADSAIVQQRNEEQEHLATVTGLIVTCDGKQAVTISHDSYITTWDIESGTMRSSFGDSFWAGSWWLSAVDVTPDGRFAVVGSWEKKIKVWDLETEECVGELGSHPNGDWITSIVVTPDGNHAISASTDSQLKVWDLSICHASHRHGDNSGAAGHSGKIFAITISDDGQRVVSIARDDIIKVWEIETGKELRSVGGDFHRLTHLALDLEGWHAVTANLEMTQGSMIRAWDLASGEALFSFRGGDYDTEALVLTPDSSCLLWASGHGILNVMDLGKGELVHTLVHDAGFIQKIAVTTDGHRAILCSDISLKVWCLDSGKEIFTLDSRPQFFSAITLTVDDRRAISASENHTLKVWDLQTGQEVFTLQGHTDDIHGIAITDDGCYAVSASADHTLRSWNLETGEPIHQFCGHTDTVWSVSVSSDSRFITSTSDDGSIRIWDFAACELVASFHNDVPIAHHVLAPDGITVVAGDIVGMIHFLRLEEALSVHENAQQ